MDQEKVGKFIAEKRKEKKLTQKELADKIGVTNKAISKWENGRGVPDCSFFKPLCEALDITVSELLSGQECSNDTGVVNYLQYKEKQHLRRIIILIVFVIFIVVSSISIVYFVNSYKKINVYELKGESENFYYDQGLIIKSNIKNVIQYGDLNSYTIPEDKIISASLAVKIEDEYYSISNFQTNFLISEKYGYGEFFNDKILAHVPNDLYIIIFYEKEGQAVYEELKVNSQPILSNDKILNLKGKAEYTDDIKPINLHQYDKIYELRDKAIKDGFGYNDKYNSYLGISDCLSKKLSSNEYVGFDYRSYYDTFNYYIKKDNFIFRLDSVYYNRNNTDNLLGFYIIEGDNYGLITYNLDKNEIHCDEELLKYEKYVIKAKDLFLKYNIT